MVEFFLSSFVPIIAGFMMAVGSLGLIITVTMLLSHYAFGKPVIDAKTNEPLSNNELNKSSFLQTCIPLFLVICGYFLW